MGAIGRDKAPCCACEPPPPIVRAGRGVAAAMAALGAFAIATHLDLVHFLQAYAAVYVCAAVAATVMMIRGPFRLAYRGAAIAQPATR